MKYYSIEQQAEKVIVNIKVIRQNVQYADTEKNTLKTKQKNRYTSYMGKIYGVCRGLQVCGVIQKYIQICDDLIESGNCENRIYPYKHFRAEYRKARGAYERIECRNDFL